MIFVALLIFHFIIFAAHVLKINWKNDNQDIINLSAFIISLSFFFLCSTCFRYVQTESEKTALENKLSKLQADQALWQDIFLKNAELENELKKEKEWRVQMQASNETTAENVTQLTKDLIFYKKVANVG